jgi:hypothetical protein
MYILVTTPQCRYGSTRSSAPSVGLPVNGGGSRVYEE